MDDVLSIAVTTVKKKLTEDTASPVDADALAWGILAGEVTGAENGLLEALRARLAGCQMDDGRFTLAKGAVPVFWPTSVALLALYHSPEFAEEKRRAVDFLLRTSGKHWKKQPGEPIGHDPSIPGWPWIADTHSWVIPTSMAVIACKVYGQGGHARVHSAVRMLLDRQLSSGGWNYGNTTVFGSELRPIPECTGFALSALHGSVEKEQVEKSIGYCEEAISTFRTPLTLSWGLSGLGAWGRHPAQAQAWAVETLSKQDVYGDYPLSHLCQIILSCHAENGFPALFGKKVSDG